MTTAETTTTDTTICADVVDRWDNDELTTGVATLLLTQHAHHIAPLDNGTCGYCGTPTTTTTAASR